MGYFRNRRDSAATPRATSTGRCRIARTTVRLVIISLLLCQPLLAGSRIALAELNPDIAVVVGEETISRAQFEAHVARYVRSKLFHGGSPERLRELRLEAREQLITERLVVQEARRRGLAGDPRQVEQGIAALRARYGDSERWPEIERQMPALRQSLLDASRAETLREAVERVEEPGEQALRRYHEENLDLFTQPKRQHIAVILLGVGPSASSDEWKAALAQGLELREKLNAGESFSRLAQVHSTHASAASGGDLGFVHDGQLSPPAQEAVDGLAPGQVSAPVRVLEGYALFRLLELHAAEVQDFEQVRDRVAALLRRVRAREQWERFVADLKAKAVLIVNEIEDGVDQEGPARSR